MSDYTSTAATIKALTVADAKTHLNVTHNEDDSLISDYIDAATKVLQDRCGRCFVEETRKLVMNGFDDKRYVHDRVIYLPRSPVSSVSSITYVNSSAGTTSTLASTDYVVSAYDKPGRISEAYNATWPTPRCQPNNVTVTYLTGSSTTTASVPANIKQALRMLVAHWYRNRESALVGTVSTEISMGLDALLESERLEGYA